MRPPRPRGRPRKSGVTGDRELVSTMRRIGSSVLGAEIDKMANAALKPMREETITRAKPRRQAGTKNGQHLDQNVVIAKRESRGRTYREFWLTYRGRAARIAHLVEFGTSPHAQPRRGIMHPGARAFPFARPAFETTKDESGSIFAKAIWQRIAAAAHRSTR